MLRRCFASLTPHTIIRVPKRTLTVKKTKGSDEIIVDTEIPHLLHRIDPKDGPSTVVKTTRDELLSFYKQMTLMRRVEIVADGAYKNKLIRGFLHLYNGQEAVATGLESALTPDDHTITAYRCHGFLLTNRCGGEPTSLLAELFGRKTGVSEGKGGSMHLYNVKTNFWGGNGIVGAQVPLGTGIAYALKYLGKQNVCLTAFGDGAANQGQVYESFNLAALNKLPVIFLVENNHFAMGTPVERGSATRDFYTRGDYIPGIQFNAMNVLASKEIGRYAKKFALEKGPILLEAMTYRYKGHSVSDPGDSYRTKEDVQEVQKRADPIQQLHTLIISNAIATEQELGDITENVKKTVSEAIEFATNSPWPTADDLYTHIFEEPISARGIELNK